MPKPQLIIADEIATKPNGTAKIDGKVVNVRKPVERVIPIGSNVYVAHSEAVKDTREYYDEV